MNLELYAVEVFSSPLRISIDAVEGSVHRALAALLLVPPKLKLSDDTLIANSHGVKSGDGDL